MKALIKVGYGCNDHCAFCHTLDVRHVDAEAAEVHRKIERAKALGHTMVVLSGGEPTIRSELFAWARHVADLDMDFGLVTNGRMLSYPEVVDRLLGQRLRYVYLSLHGGTAKVHDLMVRSEAFEQTYGALANLSGRGLDLTANCVITRHNVAHLRGLVDACLPYGDLTVQLSMVEPKGGGERLFEHLVPRIEEVAERVADAIAHGRSSVRARGGEGPRFRHGAIPLCLLPGLEADYGDLKSHGFWSMVEVGEPDFYPVDDHNKVQPEETCGACALRGPCPGLYRGYHEAHGAGALRAVDPPPRAAVLGYHLEATGPSGRADRCPLLEGLGVTPWERGRHLLVRRDGRLGLYRTTSRALGDAEIARLKHEPAVLVVERATEDGAGVGTEALGRCGLCLGCAHEPTCTGLFEPVVSPPARAARGPRLRLVETPGARALPLAGASAAPAARAPRVPAPTPKAPLDGGGAGP